MANGMLFDEPETKATITAIAPWFGGDKESTLNVHHRMLALFTHEDFWLVQGFLQGLCQLRTPGAATCLSRADLTPRENQARQIGMASFALAMSECRWDRVHQALCRISAAVEGDVDWGVLEQAAGEADARSLSFVGEDAFA